jgi:hypothetical protein
VQLDPHALAFMSVARSTSFNGVVNSFVPVDKFFAFEAHPIYNPIEDEECVHID